MISWHQGQGHLVTAGWGWEFRLPVTSTDPSLVLADISGGSVLLLSNRNENPGSLFHLLWYYPGWVKVGLPLQLDDGGSVGCTLNFCWHGGAWATVFSVVLVSSEELFSKRFLPSWVVPFLVLWLKRTGFAWGFFLVCNITRCWLLQHAVWDYQRKKKTQGAHNQVVFQELMSPAILPSWTRHISGLLSLFCILCAGFLVVLSGKKRKKCVYFVFPEMEVPRGCIIFRFLLRGNLFSYFM